MKKDLLDNINGYKLDEQQKNAILEAKTHSLIIAGAGSGKTLTLVGKIHYLIKEKKKKPEDILCITFTNEAVQSLKEKINIPNINVFTFHKLATYILKKANIYYEIAPTNYLENTIDHFFKEKLWQNSFLKNQLKKHIPYIITKKQYNHFLQSSKYKHFKKNILSFISLYRANDLSKEEFKALFKNQKYKSLLFLIYAIYIYYEKEKNESHFYDFDDLIKKAKETLHYANSTNFKEIIIDEFQDTSMLRLDFISALAKKSNATLTAVGDDFQSIYKFSGCNLDIFLNFQKYYPDAQIFKIETTYRNSQELIKIAGDFIMKNKKQITKHLNSNIHLKNPIKIIKYINKQLCLLKTIEQIEEGEILILGRNNFDIYQYISKDKIKWLKNGYFQIKKCKKRLRYLTIHKAKGLESDNVIIINLENKENGFPCQKKSFNLCNLIQEKEDFLYEEERRLFYVALTRTKNYCYLLVPYFAPSIFIKEIKKE